MRYVTAVRTPALVLALLAGGCAGVDLAPFGRRQAFQPADSATVQRITGRIDTIEPLLPEDGNVWPAAEAPRATLANPDVAIQQSESAPLERANEQRGPAPQARVGAEDLRGGPPPEAAPNPRAPVPGTAAPGVPAPGARRRGSAGPPLPPLEAGQPPLVPAYPGEPAIPPAPRLDGRVIPVPGGPPAVTSGGTGAYQTYTQPGVGSGIAVPNGTSSTILTGPGGVTTVVPTPR